MGKVKLYYQSQKLLIKLLEEGGEIVFGNIAIGSVKILAAIFAFHDIFNKKEFSRTVKRMEKNKLIGIKDNGTNTKIYLKKAGKQNAQKLLIEEIEITKPKKWDGKWWVVLFDVPTNKNINRNVLKQKLDRLGFKMIQKSVYVYPYKCDKEIDFIRSVYEVRPYVKLLVAESIEGENIFRKYFHLD